MSTIFNPISNNLEDINSKEGQKLLVCYQLAQQWSEETETPFDYISDDNGKKYKIHSKMGRDILKDKESFIMNGGTKIKKLISDVIDDSSLKTESIASSLKLKSGESSLKTESIDI